VVAAALACGSTSGADELRTHRVLPAGAVPAALRAQPLALHDQAWPRDCDETPDGHDPALHPISSGRRTIVRLHLPGGRVGVAATGLLVALPPELPERARALYGPMA
jgi:hypothetical protein